MDSLKKTRILIILNVLLILLLGVLLWQLKEKNDTIASDQKIKTYLNNEKDSLRQELVFMYHEYDSLETNNDSLNLKLEKEQAKIGKLLKMRADNLWLIRKYKKEIGTLREVLKSYVIQVDSLLQIKEELTAENIDVKNKLDEATKTNEQLSEEREELSSKVSKAAILSAKNIHGIGINSRNKEKDNINRIEKLKVCFTLRENAVAESGPRFVYLRIVRPDEAVLTKDESNQLPVEAKGETITYTAKREINYQNVDIDACIYYDSEESELIEGTYVAELYSDGKKIGTNTFVLEKGGFIF